MALVDRANRRSSTVVTGVAAVVVLVAGIVSALLVEPAGPRYPDEWDPRVADLADFVEHERRLDFDHPVFVDFLTEEEYLRGATSGAIDLSDQDRADLEQQARILRATGLVDGSFDLLDSSNDLSGEGTLAYYEPHSERITVRGTELTIGVRSTLVHELTHALQDQHFDLTRVGQLPTDGQNNAFLGLVEGDAIRMEVAWAAELGEEARSALDEEMTGAADDVNLGAVPGALVALFSAPYALGGPLVEVIFAENGRGGLDAAFEVPPVSEEQLLDPYVYLEGDEPLAVAAPALAEEERHIESGDFGALSWFLVLAEHLDPRQALRAVDGWGGDSYVAYERDGRTCVRSAFRGDTVADTDEMAATLKAWIAKVPANDASLVRREEAVEVDSCDPGAGAGGGGGGAENAVVYPATRTYFTFGAIESGVPTAVARCIGTEFVNAFTVEELIDLGSFLADPAVVEEQTRRATAACG